VGMVPFLLPLARAIAWIPWLCLAYTNVVVQWLAGWPAASLQIGRAGAGWLFLCYGATLGITWAVRQRRVLVTHFQNWTALRPRRGRAARLASPALLATFVAAAVLVWLAVLQLPDGRLHVAFLDVGQGDAIFVTLPQGRQILVDGGPSPTALASALGHQMPFWDRSIDVVVMTHPDSDHITGLVDVLDRYQVGGWLDNGRAGDDDLYAECLARLAGSHLSARAVHSGDRLDLGDGLALEVVHPPLEPPSGSWSGTNNDSLVLRLVWGQSSFLLTGDLEAEAEQWLLRSGQALGSTVLKVAHHGSGGSSTAAFLAAVNPRYAVISVGADNRFGHPDPDVLQRLVGLGSTQVLRTDESGTVEFTTDGRQLWVETER
jgi:competence protein ComEC